MDRSLRTAETISRVLEERRGQSQTEDHPKIPLQKAWFQHRGARSGGEQWNVGIPIRAQLESACGVPWNQWPPKLPGAQIRDHNKIKVHSWELRNFESEPVRTNGEKNTCILIWRAQGNRKRNLRGRKARSTCILNARAFKSIVWGQKLSPRDARQKD